MLRKLKAVTKPEISLLGSFQVLLNSSPAAQFESAKGHTLLMHLAAEDVHPQPIESLVAP